VANGDIGKKIAEELLDRTILGENSVLNNVFGLNTVIDGTQDVGQNALNAGGPSFIDVANINVGFPSETESYVKMNLSNIYE
jgi:hypothetical protein